MMVPMSLQLLTSQTPWTKLLRYLLTSTRKPSVRALCSTIDFGSALRLLFFLAKALPTTMGGCVLSGTLTRTVDLVLRRRNGLRPPLGEDYPTDPMAAKTPTRLGTRMGSPWYAPHANSATVAHMFATSTSTPSHVRWWYLRPPVRRLPPGGRV